MKRTFVPLLAVGFLTAELCLPLATVVGNTAAEGYATPVNLFDAMQQGLVDATFVARNASQGRIILTNKTDGPVSVEIPDAFIGVPQQLAQMGGMGGGMGMGGMGGGMQNVGGGGGGRGGGRGGGGGGRGGGGGGRGRGGFSVPPERTVRVDVPLLCLDHGLREPSSSKPYAIRPIENYIADPAVIAIVAAYANGDLPEGAAQAAVWHLNSEVPWDELANKLTGTDRNVVREPYFSASELRTAVAIVNDAQSMTAGQVVEPRPFELPGDAPASETASPGDEASPGDAAESDPAADEDAAVEPEAEAAPAEAVATAAAVE